MNRIQMFKSDIKNLGIIVIAFYIVSELLKYTFGTVCTLKLFCGLPCPFCGITRAAILLMKLKFKEALQMQPLIIFVIIGVVLYIILRYFWNEYLYLFKYYVIMVLVLFVFVYFVRMKIFFPNKEPYIYFQNNILEKIHMWWTQ